jgi:hypothetical protein
MSNDGADRRTHDRDLADLQVLDPARDARPGAGHEPAAQALLDRILDEPQGSASRSAVERIGDRRRWRGRALAATAAAAVAAGVVILPPWGTPEPAFASWTPGPEEVPASYLDDVGAQCTPGSGSSDLWEQDAVIAEERGRVTFVVARTPTNLWHCLLVDGDFRSSGHARIRGQSAEMSPTEVQTYLVAGSGRGDDAYTAIIGQVGVDVVGVEVHPRGQVTEPGALPAGEPPESVTATIDNGYYGAWWPGGTEEIELTIHLADGTVLSNVPAFEHDR